MQRILNRLYTAITGFTSATNIQSDRIEKLTESIDRVDRKITAVASFSSEGERVTKLLAEDIRAARVDVKGIRRDLIDGNKVLASHREALATNTSEVLSLHGEITGQHKLFSHDEFEEGITSHGVAVSWKTIGTNIRKAWPLVWRYGAMAGIALHEVWNAIHKIWITAHGGGP